MAGAEADGGGGAAGELRRFLAMRLGEAAVVVGGEEPCAGLAGGGGLAVGGDEECAEFVDGDGVEGGGVGDGLAVGFLDVGEEDEEAAHAVAHFEVGVGKDAGEGGDVEEVSDEGDAGAGGVGEGELGVEGGTVGRVALGRVGVLAEDSEAGAGAAERDVAGDGGVEGVLDGGALPEVDVVGLVAAGDEDGGSVGDGVGGEGVESGGAGGEDKGGDGVDVAEVADVGVVGIGAAGAEDEEVATRGVVAEKAEGGVLVSTAAHEGVAGCGGDGEVGGVADADVLVGGGLSVDEREAEEEGEREEREAARHGARILWFGRRGRYRRGSGGVVVSCRERAGELW